MKIHGLNKTTLLDYPGIVACTVFLGGCNFRCVFCQNASLILSPDGEPEISEEEFFSFLKRRSGIVKGVCVTGGEPTLSPDLPDFLRRIRSLGFLVKLDSNGYRPDLLQSLIRDGLIDMCAMDIKGPLSLYPEITGIPGLDTDRIRESAALLMEGQVDYEFRTTVVEEFFSEDSFREIGTWLKGAKAYYLQCFQDSEMVLTPGLHAPSGETLERYRSIVSQFIPNTRIRGVD